ncbi:MAG: hypothetical protein F4139_05570 [Gemmatimonadetes bacterium]|nr:hypothetical protein [Gemmatimonadota bacterium]MYK66665.1 hypothetical protein [Gemmatimonadota bacterium]
MSLAPALLLLLAAGGFCGWVYYRREFTVRSRPLLLAARLVTVAALVAIIWNPTIPTTPGGATPTRFVILDASASMTAVTADGTQLWAAAVERARGYAADGARLLVAGAAATAWGPDSLDAAVPDGVESLLADAVRIAAEAGAREITLVTDRRVADPVAATTTARRLGVSLGVDSLPRAAPNLALARLVLPASAERGETVRGSVEVEGTATIDSLTVTVAVDGRPHTALRMAAPGGGIGTATFNLGPAAALGPGAHRVTARIEHADAFPLDDERAAIVEIDPEETGVLLVSFAPDWEPRFLLPVLSQVTGLPVRGFLRTGPDRFQPMDAPAGGGAETIAEDALERLLRRAGIVVAMGVDGAAAEILEPATARTRRLLVFPRDGAGAAMAGVATGAPLPGEWYLDDPPPSPIAGEAGRFASGGLPPLTGILPVLDGGGGSALYVRAGGAGDAETALLLRQYGNRRAAVVLASGFWRWAFRDGEPREHYRRLWAAVGGWLMADEPLGTGPGVRPAGTVLARGVPLRWRGSGYEGEKVGLTVTDSTGSVVLDSTVAVPAGGQFTTPAVLPGRYGYTVAAADTTGGDFEVTSFSGDMLHRSLDPGDLTVRAAVGGDSFEAGRPLRTWPLLYVLILAALCCEWVGRRRAGLR